MSGTQLDYNRLSAATLEIRNEADDDLGEFDGLLVDIGSGRPSYVVVDAGGLFGGLKYLLPIARVRFDEETRTLRANLDSSVAERYPSFDADEFAAMTGDQLQRYERRVLTAFPEAVPGAAEPSRLDPLQGALPEWLAAIGGIGRPARTGRTPRQARSRAADRATPPHGDKLRG